MQLAHLPSKGNWWRNRKESLQQHALSQAQTLAIDDMAPVLQFREEPEEEPTQPPLFFFHSRSKSMAWRATVN